MKTNYAHAPVTAAVAVVHNDSFCVAKCLLFRSKDTQNVNNECLNFQIISLRLYNQSVHSQKIIFMHIYTSR